MELAWRLDTCEHRYQRSSSIFSCLKHEDRYAQLQLKDKSSENRLQKQEDNDFLWQQGYSGKSQLGNRIV